MATVLQPWQILVAAMAGWIHRSAEIPDTTPNEAWMMQIGRNITDPIDGSLAEKRFLMLNRDAKYSITFRDLLNGAGVEVVRLPYRSPNLNAYAE